MLVKNNTLFLAILFIVSLCIRAGVYQCYLSQNENYWQVDSSTYHLVAQGIAEGKGISLPTGESNFYRLPGYPFFIAFFYKFFAASPRDMLWVQVFLGACIPLLIFFLSLTLFPQQILLARLASGYSAFHLGLVLYSGFYMTETLFLVFFLLFGIFFFRQRNYKDVALAGLFLGLASLVRPVGHYLIVLAMLMLLCTSDTLHQRIKRIGALCIPWFLVVLPWLLRNYLLLGHIFFHTLPGGHFLYLSASRVAMNAYGCSYQEGRTLLSAEVKELIAQEEHATGKKLNEIERCYAHEKIAKKYFCTYPLTTVKIWITDMLRTCLSLYSAELLYLESGRKEIQYFDNERTVWSVFARYLFPPVDSLVLKIIVWAEIIFFLFILVGFFGGLVMLTLQSVANTVSWHDIYSWVSVLPFMALFVVIALAGGYARMRLPLEPFLIILSFYFYSTIIRRTS